MLHWKLYKRISVFDVVILSLLLRLVMCEHPALHWHQHSDDSSEGVVDQGSE